MNWTDLVVLAIIFGFGLIGLISGFVYSVFKIASFFISIILAVKFYPAVSDMLTKTGLYSTIKESILKNLFLQQKAFAEGSGGQVQQAAAASVIDKLPLPGFIKGALLDAIPNPSQVMRVEEVLDIISGELSAIIISIISLVLLYVLIRIGLAFVKVVLRGVSRLPVFKQIDKLGGFALGAVEGLLTVYVLFAVLMLFNASPQFKDIFDSIDSSTVARYFYENNFIIDWMFK